MSDVEIRLKCVELVFNRAPRSATEEQLKQATDTVYTYVMQGTKKENDEFLLAVYETEKALTSFNEV